MSSDQTTYLKENIFQTPPRVNEKSFCPQSSLQSCHNKKPQQKYKKLHKLRLCDMCAQDVHNLTKKAQMRQWGGRPSFLPSQHFFLPPPLHHSLPASQCISDAGVCERAQSMEHNPPHKRVPNWLRDLFPRRTRQSGPGTENKLQWQ